MQYLDLTLPTPPENLACDEALLDWCDEGGGPEVLRFWESQQHFAVVGYSNRVGCEVNVEACRKLGIPILRRCSGGGTVLQGPGCLNYSLILRIESNPALQTVNGTNRFVMERNGASLEKLLSAGTFRRETLSSSSEPRTPDPGLSVRGHTDLAIANRKFSGNAQRRKRQAVLFHGTFLLNFDLALIETVLRLPSKQPGYREDRGHVEFLTNLNLSAKAVKAGLLQAWTTTKELSDIPKQAIRALESGKYLTDAWNLKL